MKILYVEDNPLDSDLARRELSNTSPDIQLEIVDTVGEALARLEQPKKLDLALIDMLLPDGNGLDLLTAIRRQALPLAVVLITGQGDEASAVAALKGGADDYIVKQDDYLARLPVTLEDALHRFHAQRTIHAHPLRVLYVEHNTADSDLTQRHFDQYAVNIRLTTVGTGNEALEKLTADEWDVLLLDYRLPGMNALETVKILRQERGSDIPIVLVTGQGDEEIALQAIKLGASDYVPKNPGYLHQLPGLLENAYHHTQLTREQAALQESEERYRILVEQAPDGIFIADPQGNYVDVNNFGCTMLGYSRQEILQLNLQDIIDPDDLASTPVRFRELRAGKTVSTERKLVRKDGSLIPVEISAKMLPDGRLQAIVRDITARKQAEEALQKLNAELDKRVRERTEKLQTFVNLMAGREVRMAELKKVIKKLRSQLLDAGIRPVADDPLLGSGS